MLDEIRDSSSGLKEPMLNFAQASYRSLSVKRRPI